MPKFLFEASYTPEGSEAFNARAEAAGVTP